MTDAWTIERHAGFKIVDGTGHMIAKVPIHGKDDVAWARSKLLAAAPALLEALRETLEIAHRNEGGEYVTRARAAIAKAEGK